MTNIKQRGKETNCPKREKDAIGDASHVPKEKSGLQETRQI